MTVTVEEAPHQIAVMRREAAPPGGVAVAVAARAASGAILHRCDLRLATGDAGELPVVGHVGAGWELLRLELVGRTVDAVVVLKRRVTPAT